MSAAKDVHSWRRGERGEGHAPLEPTVEECRGAPKRAVGDGIDLIVVIGSSFVVCNAAVHAVIHPVIQGAMNLV